jgi:hypothetical protein
MYSGTFDLFFGTNDRKLVSAITQLGTGHGYFNSYAQTPRHLILSCRHSWEERKALNEGFAKRRKLCFQLLLYGKTGLEPLRDYLVATGIARREWRLGHLRRDPAPSQSPRGHALTWSDLGEDFDGSEAGEEEAAE